MQITIERQLVERAVSALTNEFPPTQLITALRAALAAQPAPAAVPLTAVQIAKALAGAGLRPEDYREDGMIEPLIRAVERAHGIGDKP